MTRFFPSHGHGGSRFYILLHTITSLARKTASELVSFWPVDNLGLMLKQDVVDAHAYTKMLFNTLNFT